MRGIRIPFPVVQILNSLYHYKERTMVNLIELEEIKKIRWRLVESLQLRSIDEVKRFIDDLGMVAVYSDKFIPDLYHATYSKEKPRTDGWNWDRIERSWNFALTLTTEKKIYYGKIIRKKNYLISMKLFPSFYSLYAKPDYLDEYYAGHLSRKAKEIMGLLTERKVLSTDRIRSCLPTRRQGILPYFSLKGKEKTRALHKALVELQGKGMISCVGSVKRGASNWDTFLWGVLEDWLPEDIKIEAANLDGQKAMSNIIEKSVYTLVITEQITIAKFFKWNLDEVERVTQSLLRQGILEIYEFEGKKYLITATK